MNFIIKKYLELFKMFEFLKKKEKSDSKKKNNFLFSINNRLNKTKDLFSKKFTDIFYKKDDIDASIIEELEKTMIKADISIEITEEILNHIKKRYLEKKIKHSNDLISELESFMLKLLKNPQKELYIEKKGDPFVILICGINGVGKTSLLVKIANYLKMKGLSVIIAAGDTYRAGAISQLQTLSKKISVEVIAQKQGSDSASVIFESYVHSKKNKIDVLLADTAGRIHTHNNLMQELKKIVKVIKKIDIKAPHETMLVLDASIGQNSIVQAQEFMDKVNIDSVSITKLDGTAKGGVVLSILNKLKLPIRFISIGEKISDIRCFNSKEFLKIIMH